MASNLELQRVNEQLLLTAIREQQLADQARQQMAEMEALLGALQDAVVTVDPDGTITLMNPLACSIFRIPGSEPRLTVPPGVTLPLRSAQGEFVLDGNSPLARAGRGERFREAQFELVCPDERPRWLSFTASPIHDDDGSLILNVVAIHDVTELHELERMKEEYVALISHDLRNPLCAALINVEGAQAALVAHGLVDESNVLEGAIAAVAKMDAMIQDLLDSAKMDSGTVTLNRQPTDIHVLVRDIVASMAPEDTRIRIDNPEDTPSPTARVDVARMGRAIANVIGNALKYSPREAPVEVRLFESEGCVTIDVVDHGPGIPEEDLPRLFDRYYRASARREERGHGLGLYISRQLIEAHGGQIGVETEPGTGSTFRITVPVAAPD